MSPSLDDAGAIDNADWGGTGTLIVSGSTFSGNKTLGDGGAIDNADNVAASRGTLIVSTSTFSGNIADVHGGAIDNADSGGRGTAVRVSFDLLGLTRPTTSTPPTAPAAAASSAPARTAPSGSWRTSSTALACRPGAHGKTKVITSGATGAVWDELRGDVGHGANRLGPLAYHGGPTMTILPLKGNPAIDAMPYRTTVTLYRRPVDLCPSTDQRGVRTTSKRSCNAGAVQVPG